VVVARRRHKRPRQQIPNGVKKQIVRLRDAKVPWDVVLQQLPVPVSKTTGLAIMARAAIYRQMPDDPSSLERVNTRGSKWPELDKKLYEWYLAVYSLGHRRIPITTAVLQEAALMIAAQLSIGDFTASHGFVRGFLRRHQICNVALHGEAGAVNQAAAAAAIAKIRSQLEGFDPELIYNMDETGLLYRCLPSRSYVPRRDRKRARGTKTMRAKERVTLVLCTNATGSHKLPIAMIGTAALPMCFRGPGNACPLPYFSQKCAWMDTRVYKMWFTTVFLPAVRDRHPGGNSALIMDNSATHDVHLAAPDVTVLFLPPNTTAVYQPMDAGVIAAIKRRYKRRLLALVVRRLQAEVAAPPPPRPAPAPPPAHPSGPRAAHTTSPAGAPPTNSPPASTVTPPPFSALPPQPPSTVTAPCPLAGFCTGAPLPPTAAAASLAASFPPRENGDVGRSGDSSSDEAADDAALAEAHDRVVAALLPAPVVAAPCPRNAGIAGGGKAHLRDAATLVAEEWEATTPSSIAHCWIKSTILPAPMCARVVSEHGEYRAEGAGEAVAVQEIISLMSSTILGSSAFGGECPDNVQSGVGEWLHAEDEEDAILDTADMLVLSGEPAGVEDE